MTVPDGVLAAYVACADRMHGTAGQDIDQGPVDHPDSGEKIGSYPGGDAWKLKDGWGTYYIADPERGAAKYVGCKMEDVLAYDVASGFSGKIDAKKIGMGDRAWDRAVVEALGGAMVEEKAGWDVEKAAGLPDSAFAFIEPGGAKDAGGRTVPLSLRRLPYKDAAGDVDPGQLDLAIAAVETTDLPAMTKQRVAAKLEAVKSRLADDIEKAWSDEARAAAAQARARGYKGHDRSGPSGNMLLEHPSGHSVVVTSEGQWIHNPTKEDEKSGSDHTDLSEHLDKLHGNVKKYITHSGDKWTVHAESGRVLGTHDSEADAQAQLAAVEAGKHPSGKDVHWPVDASRFRGSSLTDAGERAPNQPRKRFKDAALDAEYEKFLEQVRSAVKAAAGPGSRVQSLVFGKDKYPKAEEAKAWASDHGFKSGKVDETGESFRLRQEDPGQFARMRTITLTEGVRAVVGFPKRAVKAVQDAFFTTATGRLAFKAEELAAAELAAVEETESGTVYQVKVGGRELHFAESGGAAVHLPMYNLFKRLEKGTYVPISKSADEKRYTLGVVYPASKKGEPEPDFHGDVMSDAEIEKSAWGFMTKGSDRVGLMHRPGTAGAGRVVESYVWPADAPEWKIKDISGNEQSVSPGDWMLGVCWGEDAWKAIKSGQLTGYSLQGQARKEAFDV